MEDQSRAPAAGAVARAGQSRPTEFKRGTLLYIGAWGKVRRFRGFRLMLGFILVLLSGALATAAYYYLAHQSLVRTHAETRADLENLRGRLQSLQQEKELLLARLIMTEAGTGEHDSPATPVAADEPAAASDPSPSAADAPEPPAAEAPEPPEPSPIGLERFELQEDSRGAKTTLSMRVTNTSSGSEPVAGRVVVVLEGPPERSLQPWALPACELVDGIPKGNRGHPFLISRFKDIVFELEAGNPAAAGYSMAKAFVFSKQGELLLEKEVALEDL